VLATKVSEFQAQSTSREVRQANRDRKMWEIENPKVDNPAALATLSLGVRTNIEKEQRNASGYYFLK